MEEKGIVGAIDQTWQDLSLSMWDHPASISDTTTEMGVVEQGDISEMTKLTKTQSINVAVLVVCTSGSEKSELVNLNEDKKYFWRKQTSPEIVYTLGRQPYIYQVLEEYLGSPGEAVGSVSPWPELWQSSDPQPRSQRGVYSVNYPRKILFSETMTFKTKELPQWKPKAIIGKQSFEEKDA